MKRMVPINGKNPKASSAAPKGKTINLPFPLTPPSQKLRTHIVADAPKRMNETNVKMRSIQRTEFLSDRTLARLSRFWCFSGRNLRRDAPDRLRSTRRGRLKREVRFQR